MHNRSFLLTNSFLFVCVCFSFDDLVNYMSLSRKKEFLNISLVVCPGQAYLFLTCLIPVFGFTHALGQEE